MFTRILIGLVLIAVGFVLVWKTRKFSEFFGPIDWADVKFGGGGTTLVYKTIGLILIFMGFIWATNLWNAFLEATLGSIFPKPTL